MNKIKDDPHYMLDLLKKLKESPTPKKLYKYVALNDSENEIDNLKLAALKNEQLWMSLSEEMNDPFENKAIIINKELFIKRSNVKNLDEKTLDIILNGHCNHITCFSNYGVNNMPLWAHYANNHKGFCIEFNLNEKPIIFPVLYTDKRSNMSEITALIFELSTGKYKNGKIDEESTEIMKITSRYMLLLKCITKHLSWSYEKEYRTIMENKKNTKGSLYNLNDIGLSVNSIYLGYNCNEENAKKLKEISNNNKYNIYKMYIDNDSENFLLQSKTL